MTRRIGSLFSGIGGLELGIWIATGWLPIYSAESDEGCHGVLKHFGGNQHRVYSSVESCTLAEWNTPVDVVVGGFPCKNLSTANRGRESSEDLWHLMRSHVVLTKPKAVVVENVARRWRSWVPRVRSELHSDGYASVPLRMRADSFGAPHKRDRVFIVAVPYSERKSVSALHAAASNMQELTRHAWEVQWPSTNEYLAVDDGVPGTVDEIRRVGNAVMPRMGVAVGFVLKEVLGGA